MKVSGNIINPRLAPFLLTVGIAIIVGFCLLYMGKSKLHTEIIPHGDFAADMLVKEKIVNHGYLLTGHYSRFEFNHPGPFFFYVDHIFRQSLKSLATPISTTVFASILFLNALFIVLLAYLVNRLIFNRLRFWPMLTVSLIAVGYLGHDTNSEWMPYRIILPFTAYFLCLLLLMKRQLAFFPLACLLLSILIHGYLSMVILALPMLFLCTYYGYHQDSGYHQHSAPLTRPEKKYLLIGLLTGLLFASPIFIDFLLNSPSNIEKIIAFSLNNNHSHPRLVDIIRETSMAAFAGFGFIHLFIILLGSYRLMNSREGKTNWRNVLLCTVTFALIFTLYHKQVPKPIYVNMVLFCKGLPIVLTSICAAALYDQTLFSQSGKWMFRIIPSKIVPLCVTLLAALGIVHLRPIDVNPQMHSHIKSLADAIMQTTAADGIARIHYDKHNQWPEISALLFELAQRQYPACSTWQNMAFLYTPDRTCDPDQKENIRLVPQEACKENCQYVFGPGGIHK